MPSSLKIENSYRNIIRLALPMSVAIIIPQISMFMTTLFLGYYQPTYGGISSNDLLAASGIAGIYHLTMVMFGYGLVSGMLMLMSRKAGEDNRKGLMEIFNNGIYLCWGFSILLCLLSQWLAPLLFQKYVHHKEVQLAAISFIRIRSFALPMMITAQLINAYFIATSQSRKIIYGSVSQAVVNVFFDYLLIFGIGIFPTLGLNGAAYASVLADLVFCLVACWVFIRSSEMKGIKTIRIKNLEGALLKDIFKKSSPLMVQYLLSIGAWEVFFLFVEHLGEKESAVSQILRTVFGIVGVATWALASTSNSMVSNLIGQGRKGEVMPMIHKIVHVSLGYALVVGLPILLFPEFFLGMMTNNHELIPIGKVSLQIVVIATWMLSISTIFFNGVVGTGNTRLNMYFEFASIFLYLIYCSIVIEYKRMPLAYAWGSEFIYWLTLFSFSAYYLYRRFLPSESLSLP